MYKIIAFLFLAASASAQQPAYVAYDKARLYADADYLSTVIDTLAKGDTVLTYEKEKKFIHVTAAGRDGWILAANLATRAPKIEARTKDATSPAKAPADTSAATCAATTKSGKQCSRKATAASAYCWQHRR
jgi:hypothetical protein